MGLALRADAYEPFEGVASAAGASRNGFGVATLVPSGVCATTLPPST